MVFDGKHKGRTQYECGLCMVSVRRRPSLPPPGGGSTIGAEGLSFRVRNGTGRFPHAMTAVTLVPDPPCVLGGGKTCGVTTVVLFYSVVLVPVPVDSPGGGGFVGWEPHSGRVQSCFFFYQCLCERLLNPFTEEGVWCKLSAY